jgi:UDP-sugar transporter A1/2/3
MSFAQLAIFSIAIYTPIAIYDAPPGGGLFSGWSNVTIWVAVFGAAGGVLVALVVKYTDSIIKVFWT